MKESTAPNLSQRQGFDVLRFGWNGFIVEGSVDGAVVGVRSAGHKLSRPNPDDVSGFGLVDCFRIQN
jgi:hypothetical protein